jgi:hypothetical protein
VDSWYRHIEGFLSVEARRRSGPHVEAASAMYKAACPDGLAYVEGKALLQPLLDALQKEKTAAASRATRKSKATAASDTHGAPAGANGSSTVVPASNA